MTDCFWKPGEYGDYILLINVSPEFIDPNVHPSKTEIKFIYPEYISSSISTLIKNDEVREDKPKVDLPPNYK